MYGEMQVGSAAGNAGSKCSRKGQMGSDTIEAGSRYSRKCSEERKHETRVLSALGDAVGKRSRKCR